MSLPIKLRISLVGLTGFILLVPFTAAADMAMGNISFAWVYQPTLAPASLPGQYFHNTLGGTVRFLRRSEGIYEVSFGSSGKSATGGGNVQVTSYFSGHNCKVESWSPTFKVVVRCFNAEGAAEDSHFLVLVSRPPAHGRDFLAYLWANEPTASRYIPQPAYSYNSTGGRISVARRRAGVYGVEIDARGADAAAIGGGNVQVTAYGPGAEYCKSNGWIGHGTPYAFTVLCFDASGRPADSRFTALVLRPGDDRGKTGLIASHDDFYRYSGSNGPIKIARTGTGVQRVILGNLGDRRVLTDAWGRAGPIAGHIQVSATGSGAERCSVREWGTGRDTDIKVSCFDAAGNAADSDFSLLALFPGSSTAGIRMPSYKGKD